jgi:hypothetical protein
LPKRLHGLQLLFNAHFVQRENRNAHSSNYITRVSKIDILKEAMKEEGRRKGLKKLTSSKEEAGIAEVISDR